MADDVPTEGKIYRLTGGPGVRAISNGNSWAESEVEAMSPSATATAVEGAVPRRQYERQYGARYDRTLTTTEIAKRFREDVKAAQAAGDLPLGLKLSVTTKYFSGGSSIHVVVKAVHAGFRLIPEEWMNRRLTSSSYPTGTSRFTEAAADLLKTLERMLAAYNHDGSDSQTDYFDVRFYGSVRFSSDLEQAELAAAGVA